MAENLLEVQEYEGSQISIDIMSLIVFGSI